MAPADDREAATLNAAVRASVVVPARNAAATLPRTLAALAAQEIEELFSP